MKNIYLRTLPKYFTIFLCFSFLFLSSRVLAEGGNHYLNGSENFQAGIVPSPGLYMRNTLEFVMKDRIVDNSGDKTADDFNLGEISDVIALSWASPYSLLKGTYGVEVLFKFYQVDFDLENSYVDISDSDTGLGDIVFTPLVLGYHLSDALHLKFTLAIITPTGNYDRNNSATQILSKNHWTLEPTAAFTYFWDRFEFSSKFMYDFHTENDEYMYNSQQVDFDPGQEFHVDWVISYALRDSVRLGLVGYNYWQTTDDEINGHAVDDMKRSRIGGIGPGLQWTPSDGECQYIVKYYWEYGAENTAEGQNIRFVMQTHF